MNVWKSAALFGAGILVGCMSSGPPLTAQDAPGGGAPGALVPASPEVRVRTPLLLDRSDLRIGTTLHFSHLPNAAEVNDLRQERALAHVVVTLDHWPDEVGALSPLEQVPEEADVVVLLPGYPPSRAAGELWNYIGGKIRMVVLVPGPPASTSVVDDLNNMRHLERVIAQMDTPSRSGFERLQRPLSFRKIVS